MTIGPIPVHCISQEYWYISRVRCECGGKLDTRLQFVTVGTPAVDVIDTSCQRCGKELRFEFDIGRFYPGDLTMDTKMVRLLERIDEERLADKLRELWSQAGTPPMDRVVAYIRGLSEEHDAFALEYLQACIAHFAKESAQRSSATGTIE